MTKQGNSDPLKLHLGCGNNIREGYINVDQYVSAPTILNANVFDLPFESNTVDEIFTEHMLEHLSKYEVPLALKEWARVLKSGGKLLMNLPNLEWCMQQWLSKTEEERWGWQLDTIFGLQVHPGEFHKTGFTKHRLQVLLTDAGFNKIKIDDFWSHEQCCFWIEACKAVDTKHFSLNTEQVNVGSYKLIPHARLQDNEFDNNVQTKPQNLAQKYSLTIVVPWWDHCELLKIWEHNIEFLRDSEIIFVDNGSQLETKVALEDFCKLHNIKLIRNNENRGFAAANNQGLAIATGNYILYINNDTEILQSPVSYLCYLAGEGISGPGPATNELGEAYLEGWALCMKKSVLQALEGWSEDYGPGYWDDVDLCHRAKLAGFLLTPIPEINTFFRHLTNKTGRDGRLDQIALHVRNRGIFLNKHYKSVPKIIIDGIFFQLYKTGIARVWRSLLEKWVEIDFAQHVVVLDRAGTAPDISGIRYRTVPPYDYNKTDADRGMLQQICDEEGADLFISTYYTTPLSTPSVFMAYDMIPEVAGADLTQPMWREKHRAIQHASAYIAISENTARDLVRFFPDISAESITVAHCGVQPQFSPASSEEISRFKTKYGISKPYFILAGAGSGQKGSYKNTMLFFQAFSRLFSKQGFDIVCTGGGSIDEEVRAYTAGSTVHTLTLEDAELRIAYSGVVALVYPSKYEGFGLPVLEALACGCPVITCPNASIPEVAGEAALYVQDQDVNGMANALCEIQKPQVRNSLVIAGLEQARKFSWAKMADQVSSVLIDTTLQVLNLRETNLIIFPDWSQPEEALLLELQEAIRTVATHPDKGQITLLIDTSGISAEDADMAVSSVAMNLMMESDLDVSEGPEISLVPQLSEAQWQALLPRLQGRIRLECENLEAITESGAGELAEIALNSLSDATNLF